MKSIFYSLFFLGLLCQLSLKAQQSCTNCKDNIYVNEAQGPVGRVHKFEINSGSGAVTEVLNGGQAWYPGSGTSQLPNPHGLGTDRNGYLYIGEHYNGTGSIRRLDCAGNIKPETGAGSFNTANMGDLFNIQSYQGFIYSNGEDKKIYKWDPCTGAQVGFVQLGDGSTDWGFHIDKNGRFYVTNSLGRIYAFTPTATDFTNNTTYSDPLVIFSANHYNLGWSGPNTPYPVMGYSYPTTNSGFQGITTDPAGNIYVVQGNRDGAGTESRILKLSSTGVLLAAGPVDNVGNDGKGWNQMGGIVYSAMSGKLYTTSLNITEDCVYMWDASDLTINSAAVGPAPASSGYSKGISIVTECCATTATINRSTCTAAINDRISLSDLLQCQGIICEGQWTVTGTPSNLTFNECDLTVTVNSLPACGTFTISNTSLTNKKCADFTITLNLSLLTAPTTTPTVTGGETICPGVTPAQLSAPVAPMGVSYQWQRSTTSSTTGFTDVSGEVGNTYSPPAITQTTYYRLVAYTSGCTNGRCEVFSNPVTLTLQTTGCAPTCVKPTLGATVTAAAGTCTGTTPNNDATASLTVTGGDKADIVEGATYGSGPAYNAGTNKTVTAGAVSFTGLKHSTQYTIRVWNADNTCFEDKTFTTAAKVCTNPCDSPNCAGVTVTKN